MRLDTLNLVHKVKRVIRSCKTLSQLKVAERYFKLAKQRIVTRPGMTSLLDLEAAYAVQILETECIYKGYLLYINDQAPRKESSYPTKLSSWADAAQWNYLHNLKPRQVSATHLKSVTGSK